jgi:tRNA-2-methylthio-N6-dimethylallyladenosine synthase
LPADAQVRPGDIVDATVTYAAPHHLVADEVHGSRRTRSGDAWESRTQSAPVGVLLGMPTVRRDGE